MSSSVDMEDYLSTHDRLSIEQGTADIDGSLKQVLNEELEGMLISGEGGGGMLILADVMKFKCLWSLRDGLSDGVYRIVMAIRNLSRGQEGRIALYGLGVIRPLCSILKAEVQDQDREENSQRKVTFASAEVLKHSVLNLSFRILNLES